MDASASRVALRLKDVGAGSAARRAKPASLINVVKRNSKMDHPQTEQQRRGRGRPRLSDLEKEERRLQRDAEKQRALEASTREAAQLLTNVPKGASVQAQELIDALHSTHADTVVRLERGLKKTRPGSSAYLNCVTALADEKRKFAMTLQKLGIVGDDLSLQRRTSYNWIAKTTKDGSIQIFDADSPELASLLFREKLDADYADTPFDPATIKTLPQDRNLGANVESGIKPQSTLEYETMREHHQHAFIAAKNEGRPEAECVRAGEDAAGEVCRRFREARELARLKAQKTEVDTDD